MRTRSKNGERELAPEADEWRAIDKTWDTFKEVQRIGSNELSKKANDALSAMAQVMTGLKRPQPRKKEEAGKA